MGHRYLAGVLAVCGLSASAMGQQFGIPQVEMRIVERTGKTVITGPEDAQLNFAVQVRAIGGPADSFVAGVGFSIRIIGEADTWGTLARCQTSNTDGTYTSAIATSSVIGRGGLAAQYTYFARLNPSFNGLINTTGGQFTNTPEQEVGLVAASAAGAALLQTPGLDLDADGHPDTWIGNGTGAAPAFAEIAPLDLQIAREYFGHKNWIDVYRFRYTTTNFQPRTMRITIEDSSASTARTLQCTGGLWGLAPSSSNGARPAASDLAIAVNLPAAGSCCVGHACTLRFQSDCPASAFTGASTCAGNPCDPYGACCIAGSCAPTLATDCLGVFIRATACVPVPCSPLGACCAAGGCTFVEPILCSGRWQAGQACDPGWCDLPVRCCQDTTCTIRTNATCTTPNGIGDSCTPNPCGMHLCCDSGGACRVVTGYGCPWSEHVAGTSCQPGACPPVGACCSMQYGWCLLKTRPTCWDSWIAAGACEPSPCPPLGSCCFDSGVRCYVYNEQSCVGAGNMFRTWVLGGTCAPGACDLAGACCNGFACSYMFADGCAALAGRTFVGAGSACSHVSNNPTSCCPANFNLVDGVTVIDVFDFLTAWFVFDPRADFDRNGSLAMVDVFAFLNAWMNGC